MNLSAHEKARLGLGGLAIACIVAVGAYELGRGGAPPAASNQSVNEYIPLNAPERTEEDPLNDAVTTKRITVHVAGGVKKPGLIDLPSDARVSDAIAAAGGVAEGSDANGLNLSRRLEDGEKLVAPTIAEAKKVLIEEGRQAVEASKPEAKASGPQIVNINTATAAQLEALPGIGPVIAERIVQLRRERGRFESVDELLDVSGIGPKKMEKIRPAARL